MELKDKVVGRFVGLADGLLGDDGFERDVLRKVGTLTAGWQAEYGAELTGKAVRRAKDDLAKYAEERLRFIPEPKCSLAELGGMYDDAKERTLVERIMRNNKDDVISFHHALMDRTVWECKEAIERRTSDLLLRIAGRI